MCPRVMSTPIARLTTLCSAIGKHGESAELRGQHIGHDHWESSGGRPER
jgi:hypothetical protein